MRHAPYPAGAERRRVRLWMTRKKTTKLRKSIGMMTEARENLAITKTIRAKNDGKPPLANIGTIITPLLKLSSDETQK